jgi:hypothetical protein
MSIPAKPKHQPKMATKKGGFLLSLDSISDAERKHLWGTLFPLMTELKTKTLGQKNHCTESDL